MTVETSNEKIEISPGIYLRVIPSTPYVLEGIENKLYVLIELSADEIDHGIDRPPYNLALVLDQSGSMSGDKLRYAKEAATLILDNILNDDVLHLVTYDTKIYDIFLNGSREQRDELTRKIKQIRAGSSTNLVGGVIRGQEILSNSDTSGMAKRLFLFSDGLANVGITDPDKIFKMIKDIHAEQNITTTSFGIGKDFNEVIMMGISEHGRGDYFFIENADSIPHIVEEAIEGLLQTVATNFVIKIRGVDGSIITKLFLHDVMEGAIMGDLRSGDTRRVVVEVKVDPSKIDNEFLKVELSYRSVDNLTETGTLEQKFSINKTSDEGKLVENEMVLAHKVQAEVAEEEQQIYEHLRKHRFDEAQELNNVLLSRLNEITFKDELIEDKLERLRHMESEIKRAKVLRDSRTAMKRASYSSHLSKSSQMRKFKEFKEED